MSNLRHWPAGTALLGTVLLTGGCGTATKAPPVRTPPAPAVTATAAAPAPAKAKTGGSTIIGLPDRALTPGAAFAAATAATVCVSGYSSTVRNVTTATRAAAFASYHITTPTVAGAYEVDHLIPLELGGDNTIANLWPEPQAGGAGFPRKDILENKLHALVCSGQLPLATAQQAIAGNWLAAATKYSTVAAAAPPAPAAPVPPEAPAAPAAPPTVTYANCAAVRAAGAAPIHRGDPGYSSDLDRDGDGTACE